MTEPAYRTQLKPGTAWLVAALLIAGALLLTNVAHTFAQGAQAFGGGKAGQDDGYSSHTYEDGPSYVAYNDNVYLYGAANDGKGYYTTYDGNAWSAYQGWNDQPTNFKWQPSTVEYGGSQYVYYTGEDNKYYQATYDGQAWSGWNDTSGPYTYAQAPYANVNNDKLYLYGAATDGNLYAKSFDGTTWTDWAPVNEDYAAGAYQPYSVTWNDYENVFWVGADNKIYWNRYDGTSWTGAKELAGEFTYASTPYATGYDGKLYAYATSTDGFPYYNAFTEGEGWSGWTAYPSAPQAKVDYQPSAYVYEGAQHVVYTGENGHAYYTSYDGASWSDWNDLGANYAYDSIQYEYAGGYYLTYTGEDGGLYYKTYADGAADLPADQEEPTPDTGY